MTGERKPLLAELLEAVETETPYGGRSVLYEPRGSVWITPGAIRRRDRMEGGAVAVVETQAASSRPDSRLVPERILRFGGGDWAILSADPVGGRAILNLERMR